MGKFLAKTLKEVGVIDVVSEPLGRGGEGAVYALNSHNVQSLPNADNLVFKHYYKPEEADRYPKLVSMIKNPPNNDSLAWPLALVFDQNKKFQGYLMKKLDFDTYRPWADFAHTRERKKVSPEFDLKYAIVSILNFAKAVESVNNINFFIGDLNESNAFVSNSAMVFLVDLDAGQITDSNGKTFTCGVGKPEYTAPEISHGSLKDNPRTPQTEVFALAVASWMMLTGGQHPTDGIYKGKGDPPATIEKIRDGIYPALLKNRGYGLPPRVPVAGIPNRLKQLFIASFSVDPSQRPTIQQFIKVFENVNDNLVQCSVIKEHWYDSRDGECGWCIHVKNGGLDPWSLNQQINAVPAISNQIALPSLSFKNEQQSAPPARSQRTPPPSQQSQFPQQQMGSQQNATLSNYPSQYPQQNFNVNTGQNFPMQQGFGQQQFNNPPPEPEPKEEIPEKIKGKTVLIYSDGTWGVRPPLKVLFKTNPKVAISSIKTETPKFLRFWWGVELPVMDKKAGVLGYLLSLLISLVWFFLVPLCENFVSDESFWVFMGTYNLWFILGISSALTSFIFSTFLFLSGLFDRRKFFKSNGRTAIPKVLSLTKTLFKFGLIALFYGPFFIISVLGLILFNIVSWLFSQLKVR